MKKTIIYSLFTIFSFLLLSCKSEPKHEVTEILNVKYELRKFNVKTTTSQETRGSFFLLIGSYSSRTVSETNVRFYFKNYYNEYQFMELPLNRINIKIDSTVKNPYIIFTDYYLNSESSDIRPLYGYITNGTIYCKDSDFQPEININDLK